MQVKAGQNQADWEKSGWIAAQDPRGWFQWYCRFYQVIAARTGVPVRSSAALLGSALHVVLPTANTA